MQVLYFLSAFLLATATALPANTDQPGASELIGDGFLPNSMFNNPAIMRQWLKEPALLGAMNVNVEWLKARLAALESCNSGDCWTE